MKLLDVSRALSLASAEGAAKCAELLLALANEPTEADSASKPAAELGGIPVATNEITGYNVWMYIKCLYYIVRAYLGQRHPALLVAAVPADPDEASSAFLADRGHVPTATAERASADQ